MMTAIGEDTDPHQRTVCYMRVLEIPSPRWTSHNAAFFGIDMPE